MRYSIFGKLLTLAFINLLLLLFYGLYNNGNLGDTIDSYSNLRVENEELVNSARKMQVDFKKQVQEWKNILVRGHNAKDLNKYSNQFQEKYYIFF